MFNIGDEVVLKSGGPRMTVCSTIGEMITCSWFNMRTYEYESIDCLTGILRLSHSGDWYNT